MEETPGTVELLPLLESSMEDTPDTKDVKGLSDHVDEVQSSEDKESVVDSDDYDTDLDIEGR